ncbi:hypothetical protein LOD99_4617 [Oopsacas minuta]|uniref:Uncharacterized protein n=1 Tax=Oopsacas minuta TaxID=111878 RepID=A0AAV7JTF6_9METZ|nr:hypothetical protein LOD99_4617 [Oopsacas minuta]
MSDNSNNKTNDILPKFPYTAKPVTHSLRNNNSDTAPSSDNNSNPNMQDRTMPKIILSGKPAYYKRTQSLSSNSSDISSEDDDCETSKSEDPKKSILLDTDIYKFVYSREDIYSVRDSIGMMTVPDKIKAWPYIYLPESWELEVSPIKKNRIRSSNSESMDTRARHINIINEELRKNEMVFSPQRRSFVRGCIYPVSSAPPRSPSNVYEYAPSPPLHHTEAMSARGQRYVPPHERPGPPQQGPGPRPSMQKGVRPADVDDNWRGSRMRRPGNETREYEQHGGYRRHITSEDDHEPEWMMYGPQSSAETIELKGLGARSGGREGRHNHKQDDEGQFSDEDTPEWLEFGPVSQTECVELRGLRDEAAVRRKFLNSQGQSSGGSDDSNRQSTSSPEDEPEWANVEMSDLSGNKKKPELLNNLFGNVSLVQNPTISKPLPVHTMTLDQLEHSCSPQTETRMPFNSNGNNPINMMMAPRAFNPMQHSELNSHTPPNSTGVFQQLLTSLQMQKQGQVGMRQQQPVYKDHNMHMNMNTPTLSQGSLTNPLQGISMPVQQPFQLPNSQMSYPKEHTIQQQFPPLQRPIMPRPPSEMSPNPQTNEKVESRIRDLFKVKEAIIQEPLTQEEKIILINRIDENIKQLRALALKLNDPNSQHGPINQAQPPISRPQLASHTQNEANKLNHNQMSSIPINFPNNASLAQASNKIFSNQTPSPLANNFQPPNINTLQNQQQQPIAFLQQLLNRNMTSRPTDMQLPMVGAMGRGIAPPYNFSQPTNYTQRPAQQLRPAQKPIGMQANTPISDMGLGEHIFGQTAVTKEQARTLLQMQGAPPVQPAISSPLYHGTVHTQK